MESRQMISSNGQFPWMDKLTIAVTSAKTDERAVFRAFAPTISILLQ
ncbi:hypothetical Protein YC6258_04383 [Gynuella sunshinyii YC6258]|uniref:Uncharacterized protein n=1 Tax=Gynuella sunshinyii YC6258 TaxID=1445510 RepID=A0A0C5VAQ1_9GAMM|nr:hypothetical Protein YC6258_04383 [Gynuella sunshinyii YC6258]